MKVVRPFCSTPLPWWLSILAHVQPDCAAAGLPGFIASTSNSSFVTMLYLHYYYPTFYHPVAQTLNYKDFMNTINDEGYIEVEPGLGVKIRVLDMKGGYVDWSIIAVEGISAHTGSIKVVADSARLEGRRRNPVVALYPASNNAVVLEGQRR